MELSTSLIFNGNAREALEHYHQTLGGDVEIVPSDNKVLFGLLRGSFGSISVMDAKTDRGGTPGDNFVLTFEADTEADTDRIFAQLSAGGVVTSPLGATFWSSRSGIVQDKFGIKWVVSQAKPRSLMDTH